MKDSRLAEVSAPLPSTAEASPATDIVARLRREHDSAIAGGIGWGAWTPEEAPTTQTVFSVAADEIERLRVALKKIAEHGDTARQVVDPEVGNSTYAARLSAAGHLHCRIVARTALAAETEASQPGGEAKPHTGATP